MRISLGFLSGFKMAAESLNDELEYVKLYRIRPLLLHFYLAPFIPIYLTWLYFWTMVYGVTDYFEAGLIALAAIGILQILSMLFCHWSVHVRCLFTCSSVRIRLVNVHAQIFGRDGQIMEIHMNQNCRHDRPARGISFIK